MIVNAKKSQPCIAKTKAESTRELILVLLEWSDLELGEFVMEEAEKYLHIQCGADAYGIQFLLQNKLFWSWWRNQWARRDEAFVFDCATESNIENLRTYYKYVHGATRLNIRPHRVVMEKSYMKMVQEVIGEVRS